MFYSAGSAKGSDIDCRSRFALGVSASVRVVLVTGHACDPVVQDDNGSFRCVVVHIYQTGDTGVEEGGVAQYGNCVLAASNGFFKSVSHGYGAAHGMRQ